jgi:GTP diphosphokinase / guanosine-3',5'-bis(diphosphate) 3'-diphosphatase
VHIAGREKALYSIYRKMHEKHLSFAQVTDVYGFRVLVPEITDCYTALGLLHQLYKPVPGKFKDHIAIAKVNGYQSLHTTLVGPAGINVEFQMRTEAMHLVAESGVAAHWLYKTNNPQDIGNDRLGTQWLQSLLDIQDETRDAAEFWEHVKVDLFPDAVYVFTPKSQIMALPRGATVVDFAYAIHSNVGDRTMAARINGEQVPLRTTLKNGDVVEVVTAPSATPNPAWLKALKRSQTRKVMPKFGTNCCASPAARTAKNSSPTSVWASALPISSPNVWCSCWGMWVNGQMPCCSHVSVLVPAMPMGWGRSHWMGAKTPR